LAQRGAAIESHGGRGYALGEAARLALLGAFLVFV